MEDKRFLYDSEEEAEEALSLSGLPVADIAHDDCRFTRDDGGGRGGGKAGLEEEFEFFGSWAGEMCAAEDVFYQGRILPLRPSVSSDPGRRTCSYCFDSSRSSSRSSSSSSGRMSESLIMHPFYALPSPKPHMGRHSFGAAPAFRGRRRGGGWGLLKLGLVQPPPARIELQDLRQRSFRKSNNGVETSKHDEKTNKKTSKKKDHGNTSSWLAGLSCKCSESAVETLPSSVVVTKQRESVAEEEAALVGERRRRRRRNGRGAAPRPTYE